MSYIDSTAKLTRKPPTMSEKIEARIARRKGDVFLRADFSDLGGYTQVGRGLRSLMRAGRLMRIGHGIYARAEPSILDGRPVAVKGIGALAREALHRLGVRTGPTVIERAYSEGRTTSVVTGRVVGVTRRVRRKLGYNGMTVKYERI
jgi:hypothetical protein